MEKSVFENHNVDLLNYIYQNAKMGSQNIAQLLPKVNDENFQTNLVSQLSQYQGILTQATALLKSLNAQPKDYPVDNIVSKASIAVNTLTNNSTSHIAEMMITGNTMGVVAMSRKLKENSNYEPDICNLGKDLVKIEEQNIQALKNFI